MAKLPCVVSLNNALITKTCECDAVIVLPPAPYTYNRKARTLHWIVLLNPVHGN